MANKINSKDISYLRKVPPFLASLMDDAVGRNGLDPVLAGRERPVRLHSKSFTEENAPVVLNDMGDVVLGVSVGLDGTATLAPVEILSRTGVANDANTTTATTNAPLDGAPAHELVSVNPKKKRKLGKAIGNNVDNKKEDDDEKRCFSKFDNSKRQRNEEHGDNTMRKAVVVKGGSLGRTGRKATKGITKSKQSKLSFEGGEEEK